MKEYVYVPQEADTVREAPCPFCGKVNYVAGVTVIGRLQEQMRSLGSVVCLHFRGAEHDPQGRIKSIIFDSEVKS